MLNKAIEMIEAQQPKERTAVWMVGEQLKDMLRHEPHLAEIVAQDLQQEAMSLAQCEKKIKAFADGIKKDKFACVIPSEAERIIRGFYGLPERGEAPVKESAAGAGLIDISDFL